MGNSAIHSESWWRERHKKLLDLQESGASIEKIAEAMHLSVKYVTAILKFCMEKDKEYEMDEQNSPENVLKKLGLDQYTPEELALRALDEVSKLCKGKQWGMSIPAKGYDSDIIITEAIRALLRQISLFRDERWFHPRAAKLMQKRKNFIVIAEDETYFEQAYNLIRDGEMTKGTWTSEDENYFNDAIAKNWKLLTKPK